ncbi:hypothetical protein HMPREF2846_01105 [Staphylococcus sp. HMSC056G08]|nr:hypothetical protein HMPREF2846_01105 [Staphylococcus sp. HMSC056G08]
MVALNFDKEPCQSIAKDLSRLGPNANQIASYCNQHLYEAPDNERLERNIRVLHERLDKIWKKLR